MTIWLMAATAVASLSVTATDPGWTAFSRTSSLATAIRVNVGTLGYDRDGRRLDYWLRKSIAGPNGEAVVWTDSRRCPQARGVLGGMRQVGDPEPAHIGAIAALLDSSAYTLDSPGGHGAVHMASGSDTALAHWIDGALDALGPCWSAIAPQRDKP